MNTSNLLSQLENALQSGDISTQAVSDVLDIYIQKDTQDKSHKLMQVLYFIGGGVVFLGVAFWIGQEWNSFETFGKILSTLGVSIGFFVSAVLLSNTQEHGTLSSVFFAISALLMPMGIAISYHEFGVKLNNFAVATQILFLLTAVFTTAYFLFKRNLLLFISLCFASVLFLILSDWMLEGRFFMDKTKYALYRLLTLGATWSFLGHGFSNSERKPLTSWLYLFGSAAVLFSGLALSDWKPNQSVFWEIVYPGLALGFVFLSVQIKSRAFLIFGALGFGAYLCKITAEYFSDSLGWPLALVLLGFCLIGIAFAAVRIKKKYWLSS